MLKEFIVKRDLNHVEMTKILSSSGYKIGNETFAGVHKGWMEHYPTNGYSFKTLNAAKNSTRKTWGKDPNLYGVIYTEVDGVWNVNIAKIIN